MRRIVVLFATLAAMALAVPTTANAQAPYYPFNYCAPAVVLYNPPTPYAAGCVTAYNNTSTYLHVGDAAEYVANTYYAGTAASFVNWSRAQLGAVPGVTNTYNSYTTHYVRHSNTVVDVLVHHVRPDNRTHCAWIARVVGSDMSPAVSGSLLYVACGGY